MHGLLYLWQWQYDDGKSLDFARVLLLWNRRTMVMVVSEPVYCERLEQWAGASIRAWQGGWGEGDCSVWSHVTEDTWDSRLYREAAVEFWRRQYSWEQIYQALKKQEVVFCFLYQHSSLPERRKTFADNITCPRWNTSRKIFVSLDSWEEVLWFWKGSVQRCRQPTWFIKTRLKPSETL